MLDDCVQRQQLDGCSVTTSFLAAKGVERDARAGSGHIINRFVFDHGVVEFVKDQLVP